MNRETKQRLASAALVITTLLTTIGVQMIVSGTMFRNDRVVVWVFDVGQGDAIFIDAPDAQVLIDGGVNTLVLEKLAAVMPFWDRSIDLVINTHPHADHVTGLNHVIDRYHVGEVWTTGQDYGTEAFAYFDANTTPRIVRAGDTFSLGEGISFEVLWPLTSLEGERLSDPNAGSIATLLTYGDATVLLTGDIGVAEEIQIVPGLPQIDVLKVGHQGSKTSSGYDFLDAIQPDIAIIPVGKNDYGHPHPSVLDRLAAFGALILRTDLDGDVRVILDGEEPKVGTFDL